MEHHSLDHQPASESDTATPTGVDKTPHSPDQVTLHLHPQEELGGLLQRLAKESASAITLDIPDHASLAQGDIAFKVLADRALDMDKKITVVTANPQILSLARRTGLAPASAQPLPAALNADTDADAPVFTPIAASAPAAAGLKAWLLAHKIGLIITAIFLAVGIGGFFMAMYFLPQATITVYTQPRTIDRDVQLTANPSATTVDQKNMVVPATVVSTQASQSKQYAATGQKDIGDKATGSITISNKTTQARSLAAGSLVSSNGKTFTTNKSVTVPAATQQAGENDQGSSVSTTYGKVEVAITATAIGQDYNLDAKSTFAVGNVSSATMTGRNDEALSGGSKKTVTTVTTQDRQQAQQELSDQLEEQATKDLQAKITSDQLLLNDAIDLKVATTNFDKAVNDQAENFTLTMTVTASSPVVKKSDLQSLLTGTIQSKVPEGYKLTGQDPDISTVVTSTEDDGILHITSTFKAQIVPEVDTTAFINQIKGKDPTIVEEFLKGQPNLSGYDITISPKLPGPFYKIPSRESAIKITVQVKDK